MAAMFTFIVVVAVAAFIPYVAAPGIEKGVKAVSAQQSADAGVEAPLFARMTTPDANVRQGANQSAEPIGTTQRTMPERGDGDSQG
jgi:hypothetical protein